MNGRTTIGRRIATLVSISVFAAVALAASILAYVQVTHNLAAKRNHLETTAYVFAAAVADAVVHNDRQAALNVLRSIARVPEIKTAAALGEDGKVVASLGQSASLLSESLGSNPGQLAMLSKGTMPVAIDIIRGGRLIGRLVLIADISDVWWQFLNTVVLTLAAAAAASCFGVVISRPLLARISSPIVRLTAAMRQLRESRDYTANIEATNNDETGVMVEAFNGLIADIRARDQSLQVLAYYDPLTGLPNRAHFQKLLAERMETGLPQTAGIAVIQFNIDAFHTFNDAFGHGTGDALLVKVADIIKSEAGLSASVARVGGDEFAVIVSDNGSGTEAESAIAQVQSAFYKPLGVHNMELHLTLSAGATLMPRDSRSVSDALRHADLAVNAAKKLGPGRSVFFQPEMDDLVRQETELGQSLRLAIANGELETHYQPQWAFAERCVVGFEALLRWKHPVNGYISPAVFIPLAEYTGSIVAIGDWILLAACKQARAWLDAGEIPRSIAVNVSPAQILQSGFVARIREILAETKLPPRFLCLELTESLFLGRSMSLLHGILGEIHALGVKLALDDFGTGYSSLSYLSQLPFDKLKIDRSFVSSAHQSSRRMEILRSIIAMAHSLGMEVVAEGAETEAEIALVKNLNADQVQGYSIAKPAAAEIALAQAIALDAAPQPGRATA